MTCLNQHLIIERLFFYCFYFENDYDMLTECGFVNNDANRLCVDFEKKATWTKWRLPWFYNRSRKINSGENFQ